ncbi:universal stress protein [Saccharopolyspora rectivirgula]|jgi:nucleotide-binding universal stress UspA family protein|uniref:Universal stress protein UspA n=1 Tax=Saccharopolyspora rectivirgula TaxID=28042 RepID=A0A073AWP3_9PSEU|nr:universal stress protein [Saccharopolyspora rectivirgula]KEI43825.1 universal stress protein UspA [Saccharopolyspora rectivirgula]
MGSAAERKIVVGVDGSEPSKRALRWAIGQAELTGAEVHAVSAWEFPAFYSWEGGPMPPDDFAASAQRNLDETVQEMEEETRTPVTIRRTLKHGHAAQVLIDEAADAELLVVGSRGHGTFYGTLIGSVSRRCAVHANCPVVIVRDKTGS